MPNIVNIGQDRPLQDGMVLSLEEVNGMVMPSLCRFTMTRNESLSPVTGREGGPLHIHLIIGAPHADQYKQPRLDPDEDIFLIHDVLTSLN